MKTLITRIYRDNATVNVELDSNLGTCRPIYIFKWPCGDDQQKAELLTRHFCERLTESRHYVAQNPEYFLEPEEISALKKKLVDKWDGRNHCWK